MGLGKIKAKDLDPQIDNGKHSLSTMLGSETELWVIVQWERFDDGSEKPINIQYLAGATKVEAHKALDRLRTFLAMTKQELEELGECFEVPEDDRDYIPERFPLICPDPKETETYDLYQARLKVLAGMHPKTVALIAQADDAGDVAHRIDFEFEAVSAYYAETAHYWKSDEVKAWQRNNPIATEWIKEFARVFQKPRKELDAVDHEIVLNWIRGGYNLLTAEELSEAVYKASGKYMTPEAIKKRRERLKLTTKRTPGPRSNSEQSN